jgi:hypothetical protein
MPRPIGGLSGFLSNAGKDAARPEVRFALVRDILAEEQSSNFNP